MTQASKRLVVGDACVATDVLEIILTSGSFTVGQTATFGIKNTSDFSSIHWRITLPSGEVVEEQSTENVTADLSNETSGDLIVEVSAVSSDPARSQCFTYRKQKFSVNDTLRPHFNPVVLKDGQNEIATFLENNEIYKYKRPQFGGNQYIETHILNAHTCQYRVSNNERSPLDCEGGLIDITIDSQDKCYERVIVVWASGSADEKESEQARKFYYNYCSEGGDYCYFGLFEERPGYQVCASSNTLASEGELPMYDVDPTRGQCAATHNKCQNGSPQDVVDTQTHYRWQCVGIGGGTTVDCQEAKVGGAGTPPSTTTTVQSPSLVNGACNNSVKYGCQHGMTATNKGTSGNYDTWHCPGPNPNPGTTAINCQKAIPSPCAGVTCRDGKQCMNGSCVCPSGQCCPACSGGKQCDNGQCVDCTSNSDCPRCEYCSNGSCHGCDGTTRCVIVHGLPRSCM